MTSSSDFVPGLEGVVAFETTIAEPDKEGGSLRYRGVDIEDLVGEVSFGNVWGLLVDNELHRFSLMLTNSQCNAPQDALTTDHIRRHI